MAKVKESELPYQVRPESDEVVQIVEFDNRNHKTVVTTKMKDDMVGELLPTNMRMVGRFGVIGNFSTVTDMYLAGRDYFQWAVDNPIEKEEMIKGGPMAGETGTVKIARPFSITALRTYIGMSSRQWKKYREDPAFSEFEEVMDFFEDVCKTQKLEHAMVGLYNAGIVSKDLGMADKSESVVKNETSVIIGMRIISE